MMRGANVKIWMLKNDVKGIDIAKDYGCDATMVSRFVRGERVSSGLTEHMIQLGCPRKYFKNNRVA